MIADRVVLAIDFDGTIAVQDYPRIGILIEEAKEVINSLYDSGEYIIIIWSCRDEKEELEMIKFLNENDIRYHYINENCEEFIQLRKSYNMEVPKRKIYYDILVDDRALLSQSVKKDFPPYMDWMEIKWRIEEQAEKEKNK